MQPIITLTTDFGLTDEYVGVMKGVILARAGDARLVDLSHAIPPQDVRRAALLLEASYGYFPPDTVHVAVVDPGVGTKRRVLLVRAAGQTFLAPDNGLLTPILAGGALESVHAVSNRALFLPALSATFHGRDVFAPVAAALARGLAPEEAGPRLDAGAALRLPWPMPVVDREKQTITGQVVSIDRFGNLITDIPGAVVRELMAETHAVPVLRIGRTRIAGLAVSYSATKPGEPLAVVGSRGAVEIAVNLGDAGKTLKQRVGARVIIMF